MSDIPEECPVTIEHALGHLDCLINDDIPLGKLDVDLDQARHNAFIARDILLEIQKREG